jgi:hypothetical protein
VKRALLLLTVLAACSEHKRPEPKREPERHRRMIEPPTRGVRALPPHAIRPEGVGPYKLGATVAALLDQLPSGPRITQFTVPGVIQRDILRAEEGDAIVIGAEPQGKATFVGVLRPDIARTEGGIHVGSTRAELEQALGPSIADPDRARDPHIAIPASFKNARILLDDTDHIIAFVVSAEPERAKDASEESACTRPEDDRETHTFGICLSAAGERARYDADKEEVVVLPREGDKVITTRRVPGLVFAAPLRNPNDGRDDLVVVTRAEDDGQSKAWSVTAYRLHERNLATVVEAREPAYRLTDASARWIGADVKDVDMYLELSSRSDSIEVGGLLTTRGAGKLRDIVVISPVSIARNRPRPTAHEPVDAGTSEDADARGTTSGSDARSP